MFMGVDFYIKEKLNREEGNTFDPDVHIGGSALQGAFCYDCNISLTTGEIVRGYNPINPAALTSQPWFKGYHEVCPKCGDDGKPEADKRVPILEVPFTEMALRPKRGVDQAYSFRFAQPPEQVAAYKDDMLVEMDGGDTITMSQLKKIIEGAAFKFTDQVGQRFGH